MGRLLGRPFCVEMVYGQTLRATVLRSCAGTIAEDQISFYSQKEFTFSLGLHL
jgi:hypothetical protein